jgi:hypothetical protein
VAAIFKLLAHSLPTNAGKRFMLLNRGFPRRYEPICSHLVHAFVGNRWQLSKTPVCVPSAGQVLRPMMPVSFFKRAHGHSKIFAGFEQVGSSLHLPCRGGVPKDVRSDMPKADIFGYQAHRLVKTPDGPPVPFYNVPGAGRMPASQVR